MPFSSLFHLYDYTGEDHGRKCSFPGLDILYPLHAYPPSANQSFMRAFKETAGTLS